MNKLKFASLSLCKEAVMHGFPKDNHEYYWEIYNTAKIFGPLSIEKGTYLKSHIFELSIADEKYPAPTLNELLDWVRETFKVHVRINSYLNNEWDFCVCSDDLPKEYEDTTEQSFDSYELALEAGLTEAFNCLNNGKIPKTTNGKN